MAKGQQAYKRVVGTLMRQIFSKELEPGTKLPPERELARIMGINRTSLRTALKQLEALHLLDIRRGDGIYVKDYLKNTGIDSFGLLLSNTGKDGLNWEVDRYLIDEIWEYWIAIEPEMIKLGARRLTPMDLRKFMDMIEEEIRSIHNRDRIVELELMEQDFIADLTNNTIFLLLSNSSRPLRKKTVEMFIGCIDDDTLRSHIETKQELLRELMKGSIDAFDLAERYREVLASYRELVKKSIF